MARGLRTSRGRVHSVCHEMIRLARELLCVCGYGETDRSHSGKAPLLKLAHGAEPSFLRSPSRTSHAFYGTRRFNTVFTRALHWSLSWAISIQSTPSHPISLRSILILSTHLRLGYPSSRFTSGFCTDILHAFLFSPFLLHALHISSSITWSF
jgi:hypothetical protein